MLNYSSLCHKQQATDSKVIQVILSSFIYEMWTLLYRKISPKYRSQLWYKPKFHPISFEGVWPNLHAPQLPYKVPRNTIRVRADEKISPKHLWPQLRFGPWPPIDQLDHTRCNFSYKQSKWGPKLGKTITDGEGS